MYRPTAVCMTIPGADANDFALHFHMGLARWPRRTGGRCTDMSFEQDGQKQHQDQSSDTIHHITPCGASRVGLQAQSISVALRRKLKTFIAMAGPFLYLAQNKTVLQATCIDSKDQIICEARSRLPVRLFHFSHAIPARIQFVLPCIGSYNARGLVSDCFILLGLSNSLLNQAISGHSSLCNR